MVQVSYAADIGCYGQDDMKVVVDDIKKIMADVA